MTEESKEIVVSANWNTNFSFSHRACSGPETKDFLIFGHSLRIGAVCHGS